MVRIICSKENKTRRLRYKLSKRRNGLNRLTVFRSNKHVYVQLIDDEKAITLAASSSKCSTLEPSIKKVSKVNRSNIAVATLIGQDIAKKALEKGVNAVVLDRGPYRYHGVVKAIADAAREAGLKI